MSEGKPLRYKIVAAPIGKGGSYRAWPDKTTYIRRFPSEARRLDYWRRFVVPKSERSRGLGFQLAMIDEWTNHWEFVGEARYADDPVVSKRNEDPTRHIVEVGTSRSEPARKRKRVRALRL